MVQVQLTVFAFDEWLPSDHYNISVDGKSFGPYRHSNGTGITKIGNICGSKRSGVDTIRVVTIVLPHSASSLNLTITSSISDCMAKASLGIQSVVIGLSTGICADYNGIIVGPKIITGCDQKQHPWSSDTLHKPFGEGMAVVISLVIGFAVLGLFARQQAKVGLAQQLQAAVLSLATSGLRLNSPLIIVWCVVEVFFRTAAFSWSVIPWSAAGLEAPRWFFHLFLLVIHKWVLQLVAIIGIIVMVFLYYTRDKAKLSFVNLKSVIVPVFETSNGVTLMQSSSGLKTGPLAWLLLGTGRLASSVLFLPVMYILLNTWLCPAVSTNPVTLQESNYYVTSDCGGFFQCFGFWHWIALLVSLILIVLLVFGLAVINIPALHLSGFGLPQFVLFTIPIRAIMAWSARILIYWSPCWSVMVSLWGNVALTCVLTGWMLLGAAALCPPWIVGLLVIVNVWCLIVGVASVFMLVNHASSTIGTTCSAAFIVMGIIILLTIVTAVILIRRGMGGSARVEIEKPVDTNPAIATTNPALLAPARPLTAAAPKDDVHDLRPPTAAYKRAGTIDLSEDISRGLQAANSAVHHSNGFIERTTSLLSGGDSHYPDERSFALFPDDNPAGARSDRAKMPNSFAFMSQVEDSFGASDLFSPNPDSHGAIGVAVVRDSSQRFETDSRGPSRRRSSLTNAINRRGLKQASSSGGRSVTKALLAAPSTDDGHRDDSVQVLGQDADGLFVPSMPETGGYSPRGDSFLPSIGSRSMFKPQAALAKGPSSRSILPPSPTRNAAQRWSTNVTGDITTHHHSTVKATHISESVDDDIDVVDLKPAMLAPRRSKMDIGATSPRRMQGSALDVVKQRQVFTPTAGHDVDLDTSAAEEMHLPPIAGPPFRGPLSPHSARITSPDGLAPPTPSRLSGHSQLEAFSRGPAENAATPEPDGPLEAPTEDPVRNMFDVLNLDDEIAAAEATAQHVQASTSRSQKW